MNVKQISSKTKAQMQKAFQIYTLLFDIVWVASQRLLDTFYASLLCSRPYLIAFCSRAEVMSDVISGANEVQVGIDVPVILGDSSANGSRDLQQ